mmetsp:Transcript_6946/g.18618  ORF Transcript_6946/g.18618 Transcript_6946/m.18618 type:complete len:213 (-) Transcript_6946:99-737(-)
MMVAPTNAVAAVSAPRGILGTTAPINTADTDGFASSSSAKKQSEISARNTNMSCSSRRIPLCCAARSSSVSAVVSNTPTHSGTRRSSCSPIATPTTSVKSVAMIASSASAHSAFAARTGYISRHTCARCFSLPMPSVDARCCSTSAMAFASSSTQMSAYPNREPASMSVAQFPGSRYPIETKNAGPRCASTPRSDSSAYSLASSVALNALWS